VSAARRRRSRRLLRRLALPAAGVVVVLAIVIVVVVVITGRLVIPGISERVYPIKYQSEIESVAGKYDVDPYLIAAVARTESGFNPDAESGDGARGLMQLLPSTAKWVTTLDTWRGPKSPALEDPDDNLELGTCYLSYLEHRFDSRTAVIAAYNAGPNAVSGWVDKVGGLDSFSSEDIPYAETKEFVRRVNHWQTLFEKSHPGVFAAAPTGLATGSSVAHLLAAASSAAGS
jgi:soluble lytic murein transglycosylase